MERPISYWLDQLPAGYRERAVRAHTSNRDRWRARNALNMGDAISSMSTWRRTVEGDAFWRAVCQHYRHRDDPEGYQYTQLPTLPTTNKARARRK